MSESSQKKWLGAGAFLAALSVAMGAVGAHMIKGWVEGAFPEESDRRLDMWDTAARYQMYAAVGVMIAGLWQSLSGRQRSIVCLLAICGAVMFSGSLYAYVFTDLKLLMPIVPFGGFSMILSWALLGWFALTANRQSSKSGN